MSFAVWLTGLSGSGKSAIAKDLIAQLHARGVDAAVLESDVLRTQLTPFPRYDEAERDFFYAALVELGLLVLQAGRPVVFDATANKRAYRENARRRIARFAEIHVDTPLEVCVARDPKGLYRKKKTTTLPGVHAPYEPPLHADLTVRGDRETPADWAGAIVAFLQGRGWLGAAPGAVGPVARV